MTRQNFPSLSAIFYLQGAEESDWAVPEPWGVSNWTEEYFTDQLIVDFLWYLWRAEYLKGRDANVYVNKHLKYSRSFFQAFFLGYPIFSPKYCYHPRMPCQQFAIHYI